MRGKKIRLVITWVMKMYFEIEIPSMLKAVMKMIRRVINPMASRKLAIFPTWA
jgi:hypothetical protein